MDIIVIGGGASGLIAAIRASKIENARVTVLERQSRVGKKLSATGNGRCNLSNVHTSELHYHGASPSFVLPALEELPVTDTLSFFSGLGLRCIEEEFGKIYPSTDQASTVVDVLRLAADDLGIVTVPSTEVTHIKKKQGRFVLTALSEGTEREFSADYVICACGGAAGSKLGGTELGYRLLEGIGHSCTKLSPALVQYKTKRGCEKSLKGIRAVCAVVLKLQNGERYSSSGEVQFTEYGLSGPAIFELNGLPLDSGRAVLLLDLVPELSFDELTDQLTDRRNQFPGRRSENLLTGLIHNRLGRLIVHESGIPFELPISAISESDIRRIVSEMKHFAFPVSGTLGFDQAQVTSGGIFTSEFDPKTLESRLCPGLYACGEVLDVNGDCGGYNLQWAWSSGYLAGSLKGRRK